MLDEKTRQKLDKCLAVASTALSEAVKLYSGMTRVKMVTGDRYVVAFYNDEQLERFESKGRYVPLTDEECEFLARQVEGYDEACTYHTGGGNHKWHDDLIRRLTEK